ncbi:hypothetical protein [Enterococcus faecalis]|uniref:hypothetical protein n=1 Tax=Enterococcus faecalis TaxID=1351 RepID=UPI0034CF1C8D
MDQVIGASKEVLEDLKQSISGIAGTGTSEKVSGKAKEAISNTKEKAEDIVGDIKDEFER